MKETRGWVVTQMIEIGGRQGCRKLRDFPPGGLSSLGSRWFTLRVSGKVGLSESSEVTAVRNE